MMNPKQALEYLYQATVIERADEQAAEAIRVVRARIAILERLIDDVDDDVLRYWLTGREMSL